MSESPYAIPVEDLVASAQVDVSRQVEEQAEPRTVVPVWTVGPGPTRTGWAATRTAT